MPGPSCGRYTADYVQLPANGQTSESKTLIALAGEPTDAPLLICAGDHRLSEWVVNETTGETSKIVTLGMNRMQTVEMLPGARFVLDQGITLIIRARFIADPRPQLFRGYNTTVPFLIHATSAVRFAVDAVTEVSPCWWGADPVGISDASGAANLAHRTAEAMYEDAAAIVLDEGPNVKYRRGPVVHYPAGEYRIDTPLLVNRVLRLRGDGPDATVLRGAGPEAVIRIQLAGPQIPNHTAEVRDLGIAGAEGQPATQHGVHVVHTGAQTIYDTTAILDNVHIRSMAGNGFFSQDRGNTNRIRNCIIQGCRGSGIKLAGIHNTDCHIRGNIIRENRIGVEFAPVTGSTFTSGFVINNIIESNNAGTLQLGSATRPSMGISMRNTWNVHVAFNYFEGQLNDIHIGGYVSNCLFSNNFHDGSTVNLPQEYASAGAAQRRLAAVYFAGQVNTGNTLRSNTLYKPVRPTTTTREAWGFPEDSWDHLPVLSGCQHLVLDDNKWLNPDPLAGWQEDISYAASAAGEVQFRSALILQEKPARGTYRRGAFIPNSLPAVLDQVTQTGDILRYVVTGWMRLTNGSSHVLGTDWVEVRGLTGT